VSAINHLQPGFCKSARLNHGYEQGLRSFVIDKQKAAEGFARSFAPKTRLGLFLRNQASKAFTLPGLAKLAMRRSLVDRRCKKHPEVQFLPDAHDFHAEDPQVWRSLDKRNVRDALLEVDRKYRVALELFYLNNLSYREIVDALGIPIGTVTSRLSRGKAQLKSILSDSSWNRRHSISSDHMGAQVKGNARYRRLSRDASLPQQNKQYTYIQRKVHI
jgi:RNA polymerase sigma factor (sigma-70 family)